MDNNGGNCFVCRQNCKSTQISDQLGDRLEELRLIFGVHEALKRRLYQTISTRSYESGIRSAQENNKVVPQDAVFETPAVAVDTSEFIETLNSVQKELQQELLMKSTILDSMREHLSIASMVH